MAAELNVEPLTTQFVLLKMDTATPVWKAWKNIHSYEGVGIPAVMVIRADGKQLYSGSGAPSDLKGFLGGMLRNAGKILSPRDLNELATAYKNTQRAIKKRQFETAIELVNKYSNSGSYAEVALGMNRSALDLAEAAAKVLKQAETKLGSDRSQFEGALSIVEINRRFVEFESTKEPLAAALTKYESDREFQELIKQAKLVDSARVLQDDRKYPEALAAFQKVEKEYPDTPAAEFIQSNIKELSRRSSSKVSGSTKTSSSSKTKTSSSGSSADEKRAASYVRLGKLLLKKRPSKAKEYFEKAIKQAPDSAAAEEAQKLLDK